MSKKSAAHSPHCVNPPKEGRDAFGCHMAAPEEIILTQRVSHPYAQVQAVKTAQGLGHSRRWTFNEMQELKGRKIGTSVDEEHKLTEIFVMLPLDIIAVGEVTEGEHFPFLLQERYKPFSSVAQCA